MSIEVRSLCCDAECTEELTSNGFIRYFICTSCSRRGCKHTWKEIKKKKARKNCKLINWLKNLPNSAHSINRMPLCEAIFILQEASWQVKTEWTNSNDDKWFEPYMTLHRSLCYLWEQFNEQNNTS